MEADLTDDDYDIIYDVTRLHDPTDGAALTDGVGLFQSPPEETVGVSRYPAYLARG